MCDFVYAVAAAERATSQSTKPASHARTQPQEQAQMQNELAEMLCEPAQTSPMDRLQVLARVCVRACSCLCLCFGGVQFQMRPRICRFVRGFVGRRRGAK